MYGNNFLTNTYNVEEATNLLIMVPLEGVEESCVMAGCTRIVVRDSHLLTDKFLIPLLLYLMS